MKSIARLVCRTCQGLVTTLVDKQCQSCWIEANSTEMQKLRAVADAAKNVVAQWRGDISRKPHIGRLRDALAALERHRAEPEE